MQIIFDSLNQKYLTTLTDSARTRDYFRVPEGSSLQPSEADFGISDNQTLLVRYDESG